MSVVAAPEFNGMAYFYPDGTFTLGNIEKDDCTTLLVSIDYTKVGITPLTATLNIDTQTNPALYAMSPTFKGNILTFALSGGLQGTDYVLSITANVATDNRTDTLTLHVPEPAECCGPSSSFSFSIFNQSTQIFTNSKPRYFVSSVQPTNGNVMDQWYYPPTETLYQFVTDGMSFWWMEIATGVHP